MIRILALFLVAMSLCGCASVPATVASPPVIVERQHLKNRVPASMLSCVPEPNGSSVSTSRESASYIVDLRAAGRDCRNKLNAVGELIRKEK